ncbi:MAG: hypothetical protein EBR82_28505 [Caulobacteraceae bacterium]|nr:hypothetical protein [Caulobacteraceae bacterium]
MAKKPKTKLTTPAARGDSATADEGTGAGTAPRLDLVPSGYEVPPAATAQTNAVVTGIYLPAPYDAHARKASS